MRRPPYLSTRTSRSAVLGASLAAVLAWLPGPALGQDRNEEARAVALRLHEEGGYADGLNVTPDFEGMGGAFGGGGGEDRNEPIDEVSTGPREGTGAGPWRMPMPEWLRDLLAMAGEMLGRLFAVFGVLAQPIAYVVIGSLIVLMILLVVGLVAMIRLPARAAARAHASAEEAARNKAKDPLLDELSLSAEAFAREGRFGEAIHALFLRSLKRTVELEGRERTARELVREAPDPVRPPLGRLLDATELVWFGGRTASREDYERARSIELEIPT